MTYAPTELYDIDIYDHSGAFYMNLRGWNRLEYAQRINGAWNHMIEIKLPLDDIRVNSLLSLVKHYFVIVHRTDPISLDRDKVYEGFHQTYVAQIPLPGYIMFTLYGAGYTSLLRRRAIIPPTGMEHSEKEGYGETIIKDYVVESMASPTVAMRKIDNLTVIPSQGRGVLDAYKARYTKLDSVIEAIAERNSLDFGIYGGDHLGEFIFDAKPNWGIDRREGNTEGNAPVVFELQRGNMSIPILSINARNESNYVYVAGQGQGVDRAVVTVGDSVSINKSPWGLSEAFVDARQEDSTLALLQAGKAYINTNNETEEFTFEIEQIPTSRWIRNYGLGDYVTSKFLDRTFNKKIVEVSVGVTSGTGAQKQEDITIEMEDVR